MLEITNLFTQATVGSREVTENFERDACHALINRLPAEALSEAVEALEEIDLFWAGVENRPTEPPERRYVDVEVLERRTRPELSLDELD